MLNKYYKDPYFRLAILAFIILNTQSFSLWFVQQARSEHPYTWIALVFMNLVNLFIIFYPSKKEVRLPSILLPVVVLQSLWIQQLAFSVLPHNVTPRASLWPMLISIFFSIGLIMRRHTIVAWIIFLLSNVLRLHWHSDFYSPSINVALFVFVPVVIIASTQIIIAQVDVFQLKAEESAGLLRNAEDRSVLEQGASLTAEQRVKEVRDLSETMLQRIAFDSAPVTRDEINNFRFAEAQLRDTIRGRYIVNEQILQAAWAARKRGVKVDVLDERGEPLPQNVSEVLTEAAVKLLNEAQDGTITIRAFPKDDASSLMLVHDGNNGDNEGVAIEISQEGKLEYF